MIPLGILIAYLVLRLGVGALRMIAAVPPDEDATVPETDDVEAFDVRYRCTVCGTEMKLTRLSRPEDDDEEFDWEDEDEDDLFEDEEEDWDEEDGDWEEDDF